jgi:nitroreductase
LKKPAPVGPRVHELIRERWSPRAFADRGVDPGDLRSLLEAAQWTASCFNEQPWAFLVAVREEGEEFARLLGCLVPGNRSWARSAAVLMLSVAKLHFAHNGKPNRHAGHDVGQAAAQLTLQATALGLSVHQMAGFDADAARETYAIPDGWEPMAAIAVGYPGDPASLPEPLRERELGPRQRHPLGELVFAGAWGQTAPVAADPAS